ncbi:MULTISPECIES: S-adenosylmethionine:tRNA ribosyltransferase-isomerase [unclassified Streptomyces]|uniref:S-adenosylmethionine:tRNA ribosyltransferase-isomerase n=1 Tax=unclassified Streptomyces TaxID=2593676 RepID=UPI0008237DC2|nr:S-adenosylmethionine:tRNA ribosyltransferase-isomerase [Streptomyces sp. AmelKG-E11A]SCK62819.1 S-adenosylmethionine:tRNA ribosyltransferase-isomerase [Streptomyces sp. AmelKG-E11A]
MTVGRGAAPVFRVPDGLPARLPVERRGGGAGRDAVRLLVSRGPEVSGHMFRELPALLRAGDVLVVNTSPTLAAAVDGEVGRARVVVHFSVCGDDGRWAVELREPDGSGTTRARAGSRVDTAVRLPGGARLVLEESAGGGDRLWWARLVAGAAGRTAPGAAGTGVPGLLRRYGRPVRYAYTERDQPLSAYRTVFALRSDDGSGSAEMPAAGRPFTARVVTDLVRRGVQFAPVRLDRGVAPPEAVGPPPAERFSVPEASARLINAARAGGGRVIAVGATAVRAVESAVEPLGASTGAGATEGASGGVRRGQGAGERGAADPAPRDGGAAGGGAADLQLRDGGAAGAPAVVRAARGWTDLMVAPGRGTRVVDGLLTGLHGPRAPQRALLRALAGERAVVRAYEEALHGLYLWHEFGDVHLVLPSENPHGERCSSNSR